MSIQTTPAGTLASGQTITRYTLTNSDGTSISFLTYGAILSSLITADRSGNLAEITLGFDTVDGYLRKHPYFGATVGRYANRIGSAQFTLDGSLYHLAANDGDNHLHGGIVGFDKVIWTELERRDCTDAASVTLHYLSPDGEEGYPGNLDVSVRYTLLPGCLEIGFLAKTDKPTPVNFTNHTYFNLAGRGTVLDHVVEIDADRYTPVSAALIPTGEIASVEGTALDFRQPRAIGSRIAEIPGGYDHNYVLSDPRDGLKKAALVMEPTSGRKLEVLTSEPGIQFYTGNFLDGSLVGRGGRRYEKHAGFCLEPQKFPDSPNQSSFPCSILRPGETYRHDIEFRFGIVD